MVGSGVSCCVYEGSGSLPMVLHAVSVMVLKTSTSATAIFLDLFKMFPLFFVNAVSKSLWHSFTLLITPRR
jgi:hypothetical protein